MTLRNHEKRYLLSEQNGHCVPQVTGVPSIFAHVFADKVPALLARKSRVPPFEVFLPEQLADWLRELLAAGVFKDAGEAAFIAFQEMQELDRNPDIRKALLNAIMKASADDPRPGISTEEMLERQRAKLREYANTEPPSK